MKDLFQYSLMIFLSLSACTVAKKESNESSEPDYLFQESTGHENNWIVNEEEMRTIIGEDERLQRAEILWNERNEKFAAGNANAFKVVSLLDAGSILRNLSSQQKNFVIPLPLDNGYSDFEFSEFEGFSSFNSRFFVGNNSQDPSLEASLFISGNKLDISISSLSSDLLLNGVPFSSAFDDTYDFIVMSKANTVAKRRKFEAGLVNGGGAKNVVRKTTQLPALAHRKLRIAVAATAEYTAFHGEEDTFNEIRSALARTSRILYRELGIRVQVVSDESLIYTDPATDPFDNDSLSYLLDQNQKLMDSVLGDGSYDLGHVFSTNKDGGMAYRAGVGISSVKAMGATGGEYPYGDPFTIDYVTHEIGHQLGANHTFTSASCGLSERNDSTSTEPGSGSSIMSYAGLCSGDDLQSYADKYFHTISYDEIMNHLNTITLETYLSANTAPTVDVPSGPFTIPMATPFILSAKGTDAEFDVINYSWDQIDIDLSPVDLGDQTEYSPLFRSLPFTTDTFRIFPALPQLLNQSDYDGELLPDRARELNFSCIVRDLRGGINYKDIKLNVTNSAGPFKVVTPNNFVVFNKNAINTVEWDPANTRNRPVNCDSVNIFLTMDRGRSLISLGRYKNSGSANVNIGNYTTTKARIWIQASNNVFFDISDNDFEIK